MRDSRAFPEVPKTDHVLYEAGEQVSGSGNVLAEIVDPYFSRTYEHFCSHRQTPPKGRAGGTGHFGNGGRDLYGISGIQDVHGQRIYGI